jgi:hypothetical protein
MPIRKKGRIHLFKDRQFSISSSLAYWHGCKRERSNRLLMLLLFDKNKLSHNGYCLIDPFITGLDANYIKSGH